MGLLVENHLASMGEWQGIDTFDNHFQLIFAAGVLSSDKVCKKFAISSGMPEFLTLNLYRSGKNGLNCLWNLQMTSIKLFRNCMLNLISPILRYF